MRGSFSLDVQKEVQRMSSSAMLMRWRSRAEQREGHSGKAFEEGWVRSEGIDSGTE